MIEPCQEARIIVCAQVLQNVFISKTSCSGVGYRGSLFSSHDTLCKQFLPLVSVVIDHMLEGFRNETKIHRIIERVMVYREFKLPTDI